MVCLLGIFLDISEMVHIQMSVHSIDGCTPVLKSGILHVNVSKNVF